MKHSRRTSAHAKEDFSSVRHAQGTSADLTDSSAGSAPRTARSAASAQRAQGHYAPAASVDASQYSRQAGNRYSSRTARKQKSHAARNVLIGLLIFLTVGVGAAFAYVTMLNNNLSSGVDSSVREVLVARDVIEEPFYVLLLGTDENIDRNERNLLDGMYRTDSIMIARIDPRSKKATLVSIPRDTKVTLEGHGTQKINAAYTFGGTAMTIQTVSQLAGVNMAHFAMVDMDGMAAVVDELGGIEVDVPMAIDDEYTGQLDAGLQTLDGDQALILARCRHAYDKIGDGDEYRAANQRLVLGAIAHKLLHADVVTIAKTITTLSQYVTTDMSVEEIVAVAQAMQNFDTENDLYSATMPNNPVYEKLSDGTGIWYTEVIQDKWAKMMQRVDSGLAPTEETIYDKATGIQMTNAGSGSGKDKGNDANSGSSASAAPDGEVSKAGQICVRNGTKTAGLGAQVSETLTSNGYTVKDTADADASDYKETLVIYDNAEQAAEAKAIAETVGHNAKAVENDGRFLIKGDFLVVVGANY